MVIDKPTYLQILSAISVAMIVGTFVSITFFINNIFNLKDQITVLNKEVVTLKAEIVDLKDQLVKSRVIIAEQQQDITQATK